MGRQRSKRTAAPKQKTTNKVNPKQTTHNPSSNPPKLRQTKLSFAPATDDSSNAQIGGGGMEPVLTPNSSALVSVVVSSPSNHDRHQYYNASPVPFPKFSTIQPQDPIVKAQPRERLRRRKQSSRRWMVRKQVHLPYTRENANIKVE